MNHSTRREFLLAFGGVPASAWLAASWPQIAAAAEHAAHTAAVAPETFGFLNAADAADVDAIAAQILPGGETPGAREAHALHFIDRALATFLGDRVSGFHEGMEELRRAFRALYPAETSFAQASEDKQRAVLTSLEHTAFFETLRELTILGAFSASRYGGNYQGIGWKLLGFEDQHVFEPPFGYYDRNYAGFETPAGAARA